MELNKIDQKLNDIDQEQKELKQKSREFEILEKYQGEDRVVLAQDLYEEVKAENKGRQSFMTKIPTLDKLIGGFHEGQLVIISAPTGMGKTTFCQTLTMKFSEQLVNSVWFSYEVGIEEFLDKFSIVPICYMPRKTRQNSLDWLSERVKESIAKYNTKIVFIDHLHYLIEMQKMAQAKSISLLVGMMMRELKRLAIENDIIIFLVSHMRKSLYKADGIGDLPDIDSLRDSSFVGQESDVVLFLHRVSDKNDEGHENYTNEAVLKVAKNRRTGNLGHVRLIFENKKFEELSLNKEHHDK